MLYWQIFKFKFLRFLAYPWEILAFTLKRIVEVVFLLFFWSLIARELKSDINYKDLVSYFLIAIGVGELVMARSGGLGEHIGRKVKSGEISNFLIKPVSLVPHLYSATLGAIGTRIIFAIVYLVIGVFINPPHSATAITLFVIFFVNAFIISFAYNLFVGALYFHLTEASGIKNSFDHIVRVFSGTLVPIYLFPDNLRAIVRLTPFPTMIYSPAHALTINSFDKSAYQDISVAIFWSLVLGIATYKFWIYSIKKYEAIGI